VSSGCIRLANEDVIDLFEHVSIGTKVIVLPVQPVITPGLANRNRSIPNTNRAVAADGSSAHRLY
jgi:hypothetical protein